MRQFTPFPSIHNKAVIVYVGFAVVLRSVSTAEHDINTVRVSGLIPTRGTHAEIVIHTGAGQIIRIS